MIELTRLNGSPLAINCDLKVCRGRARYGAHSDHRRKARRSGTLQQGLATHPRAVTLRKAWPEAVSALNVKSGDDADGRILDQSRNASSE
jgi:flagellar protein FlbD